MKRLSVLTLLAALCIATLTIAGAQSVVPISGLPTISALAPADIAPVVHSGTTSQASMTQFWTPTASIIWPAAAPTGAGSQVWCGSDNAATPGFECNVPSSSTNGFQFKVNGSAALTVYGGALWMQGAGSNPGANKVWIGEDSGGTAGMIFNTPSGSTNGFQFENNGVLAAQITQNGQLSLKYGSIPLTLGVPSTATTQAIKIYNAAAYADISSNASGGSVAGVTPSDFEFDYNNATNTVAIDSSGDGGFAGFVRGGAHNGTCSSGLPCSGQASCSVSSSTSCSTTVTVISGAICTTAIDNSSTLSYTLFLPPNVGVSGTTLTLYGRLTTSGTGTIYLDYTCD